MGAQLSFTYDRDGDIPYIDKLAPYSDIRKSLRG